MRSLIDGLLALPLTLLPRRYSQSFDLPVQALAPYSGFVMLFAAFAIAVPGYFAYLDRLINTPGLSMLDVGRMQVQGKLPETVAAATAPGAIYMTAPIAFAFFTPLGLFATYLVITSIFRIASSYIGEPLGDPIMTGIDTLARRSFGSHRQRTARVSRAKLEKTDEPDRRYDGKWASLTGVDFVIVSARRKPGWTKGTWVTTEDGWFVLGEPFDRPMPNGLRTVYPLTAQTTLEVVRKSVHYQLPPLRPSKQTDEAKTI